MEATAQPTTSPDIKCAIASLTKLDNWHSVAYLSLDYVLISLSVLLCLHISYWFYPLAWLIIGSRQRGLANLLHASVHNTLAKNTTWNFIAGTFLSGYLVGQQYVRYFYSHVVNHHGNFGHLEKDPDYNQHLRLEFYKPMTRARFFRFYVYAALVGLKAPSYIIYNFKDRLFGKVPSNNDKRIVSQKVDRIFFLSLWSTIIGCSIIFGAFDLLVLFWLVSLLTSSMIIGWFIEMAEHYPLMRPGKDRFYSPRNRHGGRLELLLTGIHYDNYHLEHHLNPKVPM